MGSAAASLCCILPTGSMQQSEAPEYLGSFCVWRAAWCQILMTLGRLSLSGNFEVSFSEGCMRHVQCRVDFACHLNIKENR